MKILLELAFSDYLRFVFVATTSIVAIVAYSLLAYAIAYNVRSEVARRFAYITLCVLVVAAIDIILIRTSDPVLATTWLRLQWIGIAFLPASYYGFASSVLRATQVVPRYRNLVGIGLGMTGLLIAAGALFTDWVVAPAHIPARLHYMEAGPLFWIFTGAFLLSLGSAIHDVLLARNRCLTGISRRRVTYLLWGFVAPAMGSFPYLMIIGGQGAQAETTVLLLSIMINIAVGPLLGFMVLSVAYYGVRLPDRVVRYRLFQFLFRGPVIASLVILAMQALPKVEQILGLPRDMVVFAVVTGVIVSGQLALSFSKPILDYLIYRDDAQEITWIRELDRRLLTPIDIQQFMENHLTALCEFLQARRGFVAGVSNTRLLVEATVGDWDDPDSIMTGPAWTQLLQTLLAETRHRQDQPEPVVMDRLHLWPLYGHTNNDKAQTVFLGIMGVEVGARATVFDSRQTAVLQSMRSTMTEALWDRQLQLNVLNGLRHLIPDIEKIQGLRSQVPYSSPAGASIPDLLVPDEPSDPNFTSWVRDALRDFWGGPRLTRSPLIQLKVVETSLEKTNGNPSHALRLVLGDAIERMRPKEGTELGHLDSLLYQIMEMRFIQGKKVRDIARMLAMSESDLYRKQRVAIDHVASIIQDMERIEESKVQDAVRKNDSIA